MRGKIEMPFERELTRVEKLIPDYGKLKFINKEEKVVENELTGMGNKDILVWRQLESQAHMANEQLENASDVFQEWLEEYEEVQNMIVVQKALNVIHTFGRLLLALDSERQFVLSILSSYLKKINKFEVPEKEVAKKIEKTVEIKTKSLSKAAKEAEICQKWQRGISTKELAEEYDIHLRTVQGFIANFKKEMRKKDKFWRERGKNGEKTVKTQDEMNDGEEKEGKAYKQKKSEGGTENENEKISEDELEF